jgi:hypothetical protein
LKQRKGLRIAAGYGSPVPGSSQFALTMPFSGLTIIASLGALALSDHLGLASMGQLLTIAIAWSLVCNLLILPSMLALASPRNATTS